MPLLYFPSTVHLFKYTKSPQKPISDFQLTKKKKKSFDVVHKIYGLKKVIKVIIKFILRFRRMRKYNSQLKSQTVLLKSSQGWRKASILCFSA